MRGLRIARGLAAAVAGGLLSLASLPASGDDDDIDRSRGLSPSANLENHALMRRTWAPRPHPSDGGGRAWVAAIETPRGPAEALRAGVRGRIRVVYEAGPQGIAADGKLTFEVSPFYGWAVPQDQRPDETGYTQVSTEVAGAELTTEWKGRTLDVRVPGRGLRAGERVEIVYGAGDKLARVDPLAEREERLWIWVDGDGDGEASLIAESPRVDIRPGPPARLHVVVPSFARPGEEIAVRVSVLDRLGSAGLPVTGRLRLETAEALELPGGVTLAAKDRGSVRVPARVVADGTLRVSARFTSPALPSPLAGVSNPLVVREDAPRVLWADLHGHSQLSDGTGTPEDYFRYAREVSGLDAAALTDHDHWGVRFLDQTPAWWARIRKAVKDANAPGRFVALLGYEWTSWLHGHRHVLYFGDEGAILSAADPRFETPTQLWDGLRGSRALTFAHHSAGGPVATNWRYRPDPELEPVTEVASTHGSSEAADSPVRLQRFDAGNFVRDVLDDGVRLGFVGSGDGHDGHPGETRITSRAGGGLAALQTGDRTREGVRNALVQRRCYATNGPRIALEADLRGLPMGSEIAAGGGPARLRVRAAGEARILRVDLVRAGSVAALPLGSDRKDMEIEVDHVIPAPLAGEYLYVRVVQSNGGVAWSSPWFVGPPRSGPRTPGAR